jgi:nucleoid-associated protein YgaU
MTAPAFPTDQGFAHARLYVIRPAGHENDFIPLRFNPSEYQLQKENTFEESQVHGREAPPIRFQRGGAEKLTFEALVDTSDTLQDVRKAYTDRIRGLMRPAPDQHGPPIVGFVWDGKPFKGVIDSLTMSFILFTPAGIPLRAKLTLSLKEHHEWEDEPQHNSPDVDKSYVVKRGDTLSSISAATYKDPGQWRAIARANGIADPRQLLPGAVLTLPRLR